MRLAHPDLQRVTWDQAAILHLASANGFSALQIAPAHVRLWASQGTIRAAAIGPRGNVLYLIPAVVREAETRGHRAC